jgi:hypothetical protein
MRNFGIALLALGVLAACAPRGAGISGADYMAPGVRAAQESACAAADRGLAPGAVQVRRASSDPVNQTIVNAFAGGVPGYCRVDINGNVVQIVF